MKLRNQDYDFVVIGGGSAGYAAARTALNDGLRTCVIEGAPEIGGLCILRGCMPSKTLIESANRARIIRNAAEFGLHASFRGADGKTIRDRKRALIEDFAGYRRDQLNAGKFDFIRGIASFEDEHVLRVRFPDGGERTISSRTFLVATGSVINRVEIPGLKDAGFLTSDDVLDSARIPASLVVLGGGTIALELACYYEGLGCAVTVLQRSAQVMKEMDADIADAAADAMRRRGMKILTNTKLQRVEVVGGKKRVHFLGEGGPFVEAEEILYALGRNPAVDGLGLERSGVRVAEGRIQVDETLCAGPGHIFAAGDVCGPHEVVHIAIQQGEIAARNAAVIVRKGPAGMTKIDYSLNLFAAFCQPEVAFVGLTERESGERGIAFRVATHPFGDHGKSMVMGEPDGFVKLIAEASTRRIIGGAVVGPHASELIHEIVVAMHFNATAGQLAAIPHYHPTLSEIWTYPAEDLAED